MRKMNVLVVGAGMYVCGKGTDGFGTILPALYQAYKDDHINEIYIADASPSSVKILRGKVRALNRMFGLKPKITCYPKHGKIDKQAYRKALQDADKIVCAIVAIPDHLHTEITSCLLNKGIHCLVVKPLAPTLKEVKRLIDLQKRNNVYGAVEFHKRYDRSNLKLRDTIRQGLIGDPLHFIVEYSQRKSIPMKQFKQWVKHTNIFQYLGIHYVDIIYFATSAKPLRAMAIGQKNFLARQGIDTYDSIEAAIEWQLASGKKFTSTFHTSWVDPENTSAMSNQRIKVIGTQGRFEADQMNRGIRLVTDRGGIEEPNPYFSAFYGQPGKSEFCHKGYGNESIRQFISDAQQIIEKKAQPEDFEELRPTFKQSIIPTAVIEGINRSLKNSNKWERIEI